VHALTKLFVVLASVLSLVVAVLAIAFSINADRIQNDLRSAEAREAAATSTLKTQVAQQAGQVSALQAQLQQANADNSALRQQITSLQSERSNLMASSQSAEQKLQGFENQIGQLTALLDTMTELQRAAQDEVGSLRNEQLSWREDRLQLEDELADRESQLMVLQATQRALQEQVADLQRQLGQSGSTRTSGASLDVRGQVSSVSRLNATDETLVRVNLGTSDRVESGTRLRIVRGNQYIGQVVIRQADLDTAVGVLQSAAGEPREGDRVEFTTN